LAPIAAQSSAAPPAPDVASGSGHPSPPAPVALLVVALLEAPPAPVALDEVAAPDDTPVDRSSADSPQAAAAVTPTRRKKARFVLIKRKLTRRRAQRQVRCAEKRKRS
jgi:hypothetical protein